jgi:NAD(P)-dependent dehydrogenase (short-subunit alcohol dehydrogenase family)
VGWVNNAGVGFPGPLEVLALDDLRRQLEVNVIGQVATTQAMFPLVRQAGGRIVFIGSVGGILASHVAGAYHASKFAIEAVGDVWRQELEPEGIDVILIEPSAISTRSGPRRSTPSMSCRNRPPHGWRPTASG